MHLLRRHRRLLAVIGLAAVPLLGACGSNASSSATVAPTTAAASSTTAASPTSTTPPTSALPSTTASTTAPSTTAPSTTAPTTAAPPTAAPTTTAPTSAPPTTAAPASAPATDAPTAGGRQPCRLVDLDVAVGNGEGAMGTGYTDLVFTNTSGSTCTMDGHPGVSFLDAGGAQLGDSAARTDVATPTIVVQPGASAHATLLDHHPVLDECQGSQAQAASIRIFVPDETTPIALPTDEQVCTVTPPQPQFEIDVVKLTTDVAPAG